mmetsp:Transcript_20037/g.50975  ORF Transcript_20037/g.50975 Transcript_20037/m.50975 type:complete len:253 (+) Transcript_20037:840-1598(+)
MRTRLGVRTDADPSMSAYAVMPTIRPRGLLCRHYGTWPPMAYAGTCANSASTERLGVTIVRRANACDRCFSAPSRCHTPRESCRWLLELWVRARPHHVNEWRWPPVTADAQSHFPFPAACGASVSRARGPIYHVARRWTRESVPSLLSETCAVAAALMKMQGPSDEKSVLAGRHTTVNKPPTWRLSIDRRDQGYASASGVWLSGLAYPCGRGWATVIKTSGECRLAMTVASGRTRLSSDSAQHTAVPVEPSK